MMKRLVTIVLALAANTQLFAQMPNDAISPYIHNVDDSPTSAQWINPVKVVGDFILFEEGNTYEVKIFAMSGELVKQITTSSKLNIPLMNLEPGRYLVKARTERKSGKTVLTVG